MRNLLDFLVKYNHCFLFLLLEVASFALLIRFNYYQQSVFFTSANEVSGRMYDVVDGVSAYFHLKQENRDLLERNVYLEQRVAELEQTQRSEQADQSEFASMAGVELEGGETVGASVVKNSINRKDNYLTLNRGSRHGVSPEAGVVGPNGVVGIVYKTSPHFALVISLLNSKSSISCKISGSDYFGYLKWDGIDSRYAYLMDVPRHATFSIGDSVVTSGYSTVFPPGLMVGIVDNMSDSDDGLSYLLKVRLATDFGRVTDVRVVGRPGADEERELEQQAE